MRIHIVRTGEDSKASAKSQKRTIKVFFLKRIKTVGGT